MIMCTYIMLYVLCVTVYVQQASKEGSYHTVTVHISSVF